MSTLQFVHTPLTLTWYGEQMHEVAVHTGDEFMAGTQIDLVNESSMYPAWQTSHSVLLYVEHNIQWLTLHVKHYPSTFTPKEEHLHKLVLAVQTS